MKLRIWFLSGVALLALAATPTWATPFYTSGHADLGIAYEDDEFDIHFHAEGATVGGVFYADEEFEADGVIIYVPTSTLEPRTINVPALLNFDPIGVAAGVNYYKLPQTNAEATSENAPFLGIGTEEIESGIFVGNVITLSIESVVGPGFFSIFQDAIPGPTFKAASYNGLPDAFSYATGGHDHFNFGFTAPGVYEVTFKATGTLVSGGTVSGEGTYTFAVAVPEVSTFALSGVAGLLAGTGYLWRRRRGS